jgi:acyl-CoA thioester hydrolase
MVEARVRVIYADTDQMGVVYYANYFRYFEIGRTEFFRALGRTYRELEATESFLPVVEAFCHYHASARYDDLLRVRTRLQTVRRASIAFEYEILRNEDPNIISTGHTVHACVDKSGKPTRIPESVMRLLRGEAE